MRKVSSVSNSSVFQAYLSGWGRRCLIKKVLFRIAWIEPEAIYSQARFFLERHSTVVQSVVNAVVGLQQAKMYR